MLLDKTTNHIEPAKAVAPSLLLFELVQQLFFYNADWLAGAVGGAKKHQTKKHSTRVIVTNRNSTEFPLLHCGSERERRQAEGGGDDIPRADRTGSGWWAVPISFGGTRG